MKAAQWGFACMNSERAACFIASVGAHSSVIQRTVGLWRGSPARRVACSYNYIGDAAITQSCRAGCGAPAHHVRIIHDRPQILVAEAFLHRADVGAFFEQVPRDRVVLEGQSIGYFMVFHLERVDEIPPR